MSRMDAMKKLFAQEEDELIKLGSILEQTGGYLPPDKLEAVVNIAANLQAKGAHKSDEEEEWLADFIRNIGHVLVNDKQLDQRVEARA